MAQRAGRSRGAYGTGRSAQGEGHRVQCTGCSAQGAVHRKGAGPAEAIIEHRDQGAGQRRPGCRLQGAGRRAQGVGRRA